MKLGVLLLGHGSRASEANDAIKAVAQLVRASDGIDIVELGFMDHSKPSIPDGVAACVRQGAKRIIVIPYFLHFGMHVQKDLPSVIDQLREEYPDVEMVMGKHLGFHSKLAEIVIERVHEVVDRVHEVVNA